MLYGQVEKALSRGVSVVLRLLSVDTLLMYDFVLVYHRSEGTIPICLCDLCGC